MREKPYDALMREKPHAAPVRLRGNKTSARQGGGEGEASRQVVYGMSCMPWFSFRRLRFPPSLVASFAWCKTFRVLRVFSGSNCRIIPRDTRVPQFTLSFSLFRDSLDSVLTLRLTLRRRYSNER